MIRGRAIPLCWGSYSDKTLGKSQNALEEALLLTLREMLGPACGGVKVILLADRGFGRAELGRFCQRLGFDDVIRIKSKVRVKFNDQRVRLDRYPVHRGVCELHKHVLYRCDLKGLAGDAMNVVLAAAGTSLAKRLRLLPCAWGGRGWIAGASRCRSPSIDTTPSTWRHDAGFFRDDY